MECVAKPDSQLPVRLPRAGESGVPFIEWLAERLDNDRIERQRLGAFIQEWDHLRDEIHQTEIREPTVEEYAVRWGVAVSSAYRLRAEFRRVVGLEYPGPLCDLLWDGMATARQAPARPRWILGVRVVAT